MPAKSLDSALSVVVAFLVRQYALHCGMHVRFVQRDHDLLGTVEGGNRKAAG
jgi:hypothetical protein